MTAGDDFELLLDEWFHEAAPARPPDALLPAVLARTARTPRRAAWRLRDHWLSPAASIRLGAARRTALVFALLALLVAALLAGPAIVGSLNRHAPPFGLARPGLIAFDSAGQIWVANADGSGARQLTHDSEMHIDPTWSPDGTMLAFWSKQLVPSGGVAPSTVGPADLTVVEADGSNRRVVAATGPIDAPSFAGWSGALRIAWAPDSGRIAYSYPGPAGSPVYVANVDGSGLEAVGNGSPNGAVPAWSPDGTELAFVGGRYDTDRAIYVMRADGSAVRRLTAPGLATEPGWLGWSPRGDLLAFQIGTASGSSHVIVVSSDGRRELDLSEATSDSTVIDFAPAWSPDGSHLALFRERPGEVQVGHIMIVEPDGSHPTTLAPTVGGGVAIWSPDGSRISTYLYNDSLGTADRLIVIDIRTGASFIIPGSGTQGFGSWQRLAP